MKPNYEVAIKPGSEDAGGSESYEPAGHQAHVPLKRNMRVTLNLPVSLLDRMRNTVYWTPGLTLTALITGAVQESLDHLERQQGKPFPARLGELKSGRPRKRPAFPSRYDSEHARFVRPAGRQNGTGFVASPLE